MAWTIPRTWTAGEIPTAAIFNAHVRDNLIALQDRVQVVVKSADETVNNSAVLQNDDELSFTAVAGQTYVFELHLILATTSNAADFAPAFNFPAGTLVFGGTGLDTAATSSIASVRLAATSGATSSVSPFSFGAITTASTGLTIKGTYVCTTGGTVRFQWAQATATVADTQVLKGSHLIATRKAA